jgi:hypothetical protein
MIRTQADRRAQFLTRGQTCALPELFFCRGGDGGGGLSQTTQEKYRHSNTKYITAALFHMGHFHFKM